MAPDNDISKEGLSI
ncbi:hypothetical protein VTN00DRAFT_2867 [Thermoascus crustaceus]